MLGWRVLIVPLALTMALAACGGFPGPSPSPTPIANPWLAEDRVAQAIDIRKRFGLRADETWVRLVAEIPEAIAPPLLYEIPLTPQERTILEQRASDVDRVLSVVNAYGSDRPDAWAGAWKDPQTGAVTVRFTGTPAEHEAALRALVAPNTKLIVLSADWSLAELEALEARIVEDLQPGATWLREHGIVGTALSIDEMLNQVEFDVSSTRLDLDALLEARYDAVGMLSITSDGNGVLLLPTGDLAGRVVNADGKPVAYAVLELRSDVRGAGPQGDMAHGTNSTGRFLFEDIQAVTYTVVVYHGDDPYGVELGRSDPITVVANDRTTIEIIIP